MHIDILLRQTSDISLNSRRVRRHYKLKIVPKDCENGTNCRGFDEFPKLYHERWDIEELYKISKTLIQVQDFHAQSERGVKQELFAHFVVITLSRIFSNHIESGTIHEKHCSPDREIKVNMKNCLITIARNLEVLFIQQNIILKKTISNIVNSVINCRQKKRPHRSYERRSKKPFSKWQAANTSIKAKTAAAG